MMDSTKSELELRLVRLEKRLRLLQTFLIIAASVIVAAVPYFWLHYGFSASRSPDVLRAKGLIIQDDAGHERILIGAPVPTVSGRKRHDDTVGIIIIGKDGADRLALGAPVPEPQIQSEAGKRVGQETGLIIDDPNGDERGGFGVLDNDGRVALGLDYPHGKGQAINIGVLPGEASISINDSSTLTRASLLERNNAAPLLFGLDIVGKSKIDMSVLRLSPYRVRHLQTAATDEALNNALDTMSR